MKKLLFGLLILMVACNSNKSENNKTTKINRKEDVMFPFTDTTFSWKDIEKRNDTLKLRFKKMAPSLLGYEYEFYTGAGGQEHTEKEFEHNCHVIDLNNDGLDDIIYTGSTGSEGSEVVIFLNTGNGFKKVLKQVENIVKLEFVDHKLFRLYIQDSGCCDAWIDFNRIYQVDYRNNIPKFNTIYLTSNLHIARFPKKYFDKPIYFEVLHDNYKMHLEPRLEDTIIDDFTFAEHSFKTSNIVDTLIKGTKGRAIASQIDKTGRIWWLVEIDSSYKAYGNLFYEQQGDTINKASKMGWISSRYLKKLGE